MEKKIIKIALDLDNTLFDSSEYVYNKCLKENLSQIKKISLEEFKMFFNGLEEPNHRTLRFLNKTWGSIHNFDNKNRIRNSIVELVKKLREKVIQEDEFEIVVDIVTARKRKYLSIVDLSLFPSDLDINKVVCSRKKHKLNYDVYIDDDCKLIKEISNIDNKIMIKSLCGYNKDLKSDFEVSEIKMFSKEEINEIYNKIKNIK